MTSAKNVVVFPTKEEEHNGVIAPGLYSAVYVRHEGTRLFDGNKVKVLFRLVEHLELLLARFYPVTGYKGRINAPARSAIVREVQAGLGHKIRRDQIPLASLKDIIVKVEVSTVTRDYKQQPLAEVNQYSLISRIIGRAEW